MNISIFEITVPQFILSLQALKKILLKMPALADKQQKDIESFFQERLAADQFPLGRQVQIACDIAKFCAARLSGEQGPSYEDNEKSLDEYLARIDKTIDYLRQFKAEQFVGYEKRRVSFPWYPGHYLEGHNYLVQHAIPNFFFHMSTAYNILRHLGADLGKADYLGQQNWKKE